MNRAPCAIKSGEVFDAVVHDQRCGARHVFFNTSPPPPPSYLPHLESIKELWEEGENLTTNNAPTMPGKTSGTTFIPPAEFSVFVL